jgi:TRAP-type C4-dicarboxylate transport system permease large subunit
VSAVLAVIIPPSILMIVWGGVLSVLIGALYLAGILPGILIAGAQMVTVHVYAKHYSYPVYPRAAFREFLCSAARSVPALTTPFFIMIMLVPMLVVLAAIIIWPEIPLLLPRLLSPEFLR